MKIRSDNLEFSIYKFQIPWPKKLTVMETTYVQLENRKKKKKPFTLFFSMFIVHGPEVLGTFMKISYFTGFVHLMNHFLSQQQFSHTMAA